MARRHSHFTRRLPILIAFIVGLLLCVAATPAAAENIKSAKSDLICHTSDSDECYPRTFQPTDEFQTVHDDQELPSGLHVRLNIWTGKKEAKINVPGEEDASLRGLPVDQGIIVVDPQEAEDVPVIPKGAPAYEAVGKVKEPQHESAAFYEGLQMLKKGVAKDDRAFDDALDGLEDLSHDMYYGLKIAEDSDALKALFCLMSGPSTPSTPSSVPRDQQAAAILAGTLQNNPTALQAVGKAWPAVAPAECKNTGELLRRSVYSSVLPSRNGQDDDQLAAARVKSKVAVINGLIKDSGLRAEFLSHGGMESLLRVLVPEGKDWVGAQRKAGQLALDNFLDEDMGAMLGQWPVAPKLSDKQCQADGSSEGCWDYHVARVMKAAKAGKGHWSRELNDRLAAARKLAGKPSAVPKHEEL